MAFLVFHLVGGDETSFIKDFKTNRVLGLENSATIDHTNVILEDKVDSMSQKWILVPYNPAIGSEEKGWFLLKNKLSQRYLTSRDSKDLRISGMYEHSGEHNET